MNLKDFSRRVYERICYSIEKKRVLYVGVSPKRRDIRYLEFLDKNNKLITCDKEKMLINYGAENHYVLDISKETSFPDNYFDIIIMLGVLGYGLDDGKEILRTFENLKRILKPRGKVFFELSKDRRIN